MKPRFKKTRFPSRITYGGTITLKDLQKAFGIPEDAEVTVAVPSGGDYSGQKLDVGEIQVRWERVE